MTSITTLADQFVTRIVAHEYAKVRNDVPSKADADGNVVMLPNKKKYSRTAAVVSAKYGLLLEAKLIKAHKVSAQCDTVARR